MNQFTCPECQSSYQNDFAGLCPQCGYNVELKKMVDDLKGKLVLHLGGLLLLVFSLSVFIYYWDDDMAFINLLLILLTILAMIGCISSASEIKKSLNDAEKRLMAYHIQIGKCHSKQSSNSQAQITNKVQIIVCVFLILTIGIPSYFSLANKSQTPSNEIITELPEITIPTQKDNEIVLCEKDGCSQAGHNAIEGFSGEMEYYCHTHYNEIQNMIADMVKITVACEKDGCSKKGTYAIENFVGETEYYCYTHYNDIQEMLDSLFNEPNYGNCDNCGRPAKYKWDEKTAYCESCFESLVNYIFKN